MERRASACVLLSMPILYLVTLKCDSLMEIQRGITGFEMSECAAA